jgi:hypothetical protein
MDHDKVTARQALEAQLIDRAMKDEGFRQALVHDPKSVFERELGIRVPENLTVEVLEESPTTVYLVLPRPLANAGVELSDEELQAAAGGTSGWDTCGDTCYTCWKDDGNGYSC